MAGYMPNEPKEAPVHLPQRVVALLDMDSFECQIWQRMYPDFWGHPCIVTDQTGRIVSATHQARQLGISRKIRLREARRIAVKNKVSLQVFQKPNDREKPDGRELRYASWEIIDALKSYCSQYAFGVIMEVASNDEVYLDITEEVKLRMESFTHISNPIETKTFLEAKEGQISGTELSERILNYPFNQESLDEEGQLVEGGIIMQEVNNFLFAQTKYTASCGIGSNKLMAKLAVSLNKPNGITILPCSSLSRIGKIMKLETIPGLGGKTGSQISEIFAIKTVSELSELLLDDLEEVVGEDKALEAYLKCRGICDELVREKDKNIEVSCGKRFFGQITSDETLQYHLVCLFEEMHDRLGEERIRHKRSPSFVRVQLIYLCRNETQEGDSDNPKWTCPIYNVQTKTPDKLSEEVLNKIFKEIKEDISALNITRIILTAKQFNGF